MLVLDPTEQKRILESRANTNADRYDEVWDGVYIVFPPAGEQHQELRGKLTWILQATVGCAGIGLVRPGVYVSDRADDWTQNYRCPDVVVYLDGNPAENRHTHWLGGPDFLVEIASPHDRSREKLDFYATIGTREALLIDRSPWSIGLYRPSEGRMTLVGTSTPDDPQPLRSGVLPLSFRLVAGGPRPAVEVAHADGVQRWSA